MINNNENKLIWENNLFETIYDISDIEMQKLMWNGIHPNYVSSFSEILSDLYDAFDFERYIEYYKFIKGEDSFFKMINDLNQMIKKYKNFGYEIELTEGGHNKILNDINWVKITNKAKEIYENKKPMSNTNSPHL